MRRILRFSTFFLLAACTALAAACDDDETKTREGEQTGEEIVLEASHALGARTERAMEDRSHRFKLVLSDTESAGTVEDPTFAAAGKYVSIILYALETQQGVLPEGTYPLSGSAPAAGKGDLAASRYATATPEQMGGGAERLLGGSVSVTHLENGYRIEVTATLSRKRTLSCVYEGEVAFESVYDIALDARHALGLSQSDALEDGSTNFIVTLSDCEMSGDAENPVLGAAGQLLTIDLYAPEAEKGILPMGNYRLVTGDPGPMEGSLAKSGYRLADASGAIDAPTPFRAAEVTVYRSESDYRIVVTGTFEDGSTFCGSYQGPIVFVEKPKPGPTYDVTITAPYALGVCTADVLDDGSSEYYILLSDTPIEGTSEEPVFSGAGKFAILDLCAIPQEGMLPEGTYPFVPEIPTNMQGVLDFSGYGETDAAGDPTTEEPVYFSECTATVAYTDDGYKIEATGTLEDGRTFHIVYEGYFEFEEGGGGITLPGLETDVQTTFTIGESIYYGISMAGTGEYTVDLWDNDFDQNFQTTNRLSLTLFTAPSETPLALAPGTYRVAASGAAATFFPGSFDMETLQVVGSYCEQTLVRDADYTLLYGMIADGTVEVAVDNGQYTLTADLTDTEGHSIRGTYTGTLAIEDRSVASTLDGDKQADVTGMPCWLDYYADYFGVRGDNWSLFIGTEEDGTEAFQIELIAPMATYAEGLPAGEYTVTAIEAYPAGGKICVPGVMVRSRLFYSWYLGDYRGGPAYSTAPFTSGKVIVSRDGDQYTFTMDVYDDKPTPNHITGTWTGTPIMSDESGAQPAPQLRSSRTAPAGRAASARSIYEQAAAHAVKVKAAPVSRYGR